MSDRSTPLPEIAITAAAIRCSWSRSKRAEDAMLGGKVGIDEAGDEAFLDEPGQRPHAAQAMPTSALRSDRAETELNACVTSALAEARLLRGGRGTPETVIPVETVFDTTLGGMRHLGLRSDRLGRRVREDVDGTLNRDCLVGTGLQLGEFDLRGLRPGVSAARSRRRACFSTRRTWWSRSPTTRSASSPTRASTACVTCAGPLRPFTADREGCGRRGLLRVRARRSDDADARGRCSAACSTGVPRAIPPPDAAAPDGRRPGDSRRGSSNARSRPRTATSTPAMIRPSTHRSRRSDPRWPASPRPALKSRIGHTLCRRSGRAESPRRDGAGDPRRRQRGTRSSVLPRSRSRSSLSRRRSIAAWWCRSVSAARMPRSRSSPRPPRNGGRRDSRGPRRRRGRPAGRLVDRASRPTRRRTDSRTIAGLDQPRAVRRSLASPRLVRAVGRIAVQDAGLDEEEIRKSSAFVGTRFGAAEYTLYYRGLISGGPTRATHCTSPRACRTSAARSASVSGSRGSPSRPRARGCPASRRSTWRVSSS